MALKARVASLDEVAEPHRSEYKPAEGGGFVLDLDGVDDHPSVRGLKSAHERQKDENARIKQRWAGLPDDLTTDRVKELLEADKTAKEKNARAAGEFDNLKAQLLETHTQEKGVLEGKIKTRDGQIERLVGRNAAAEALAKVGGRVKVMMPHVMGFVTVIEDTESGEFHAVVVDDKKKPRYSKKTPGEPMSIEELVEEMKEDPEYAANFDGAGASGSGAPTDKGRPGPGTVRSAKEFKTDADRLAYIDKHGREEYEKLLVADAEAAAAGKK
jgi:hypothetical protein